MGIKDKGETCRIAIQAALKVIGEVCEDESVYHITNINKMDELTQKAKTHFGTTANFKESGYILYDGDMLDFSGKKKVGWMKGQKMMDHRDIRYVYLLNSKNQYKHTDHMRNFMAEANAIRFNPLDAELGSVSIEITEGQTITPKQYEQLARIQNDHGIESIVYDVVKDGCLVNTGESGSVSELKVSIQNRNPGLRKKKIIA